MDNWFDRNIPLQKTVNELVLITKAKRGDRDAFGKLYLTYLPGIYRYIFFRVGQRHEDAEDLAETVLVRAWEALDRYRLRKGSFRVWLFVIAHNALVDYYREHAKRAIATINSDVPDETVRGVSPEETLIVSDIAKQLRRALEQLSDEHKQVIVLRYTEDMSYAQIAKITGKRQDALRALHHRALIALKKLIKDI